MNEKVVRLRVVDGVVYASSLTMAEDFGGRRGGHDTMLELINKVRNDPEMSSIYRTSWFRDETYFDSYDRQQPCIDMTRDGFTLVMMNYRGNVAWKIAYILKFDEMEGKLGAGARTEALFDRTKRDNVVKFQGPPPAQGELFAAPPAPENKPDGVPEIIWARHGHLREWFRKVGPDGRITDAQHEPSGFWRWTRAEWFSLPLELRQQFWTETNYNKKPLNGALVERIRTVLADVDCKARSTPPSGCPNYDAGCD